jgi:hypothetical protein
MSENWFSGRYLTVSMGLNTTLGLISAATSNWFTPLIANNYRNIATPFVFCGIVCFIGFIFAVIAAVIEFFNIDQLKPHTTDYVEVTGDDETTIMNFAGDLENYKFSWGDLKNMGALFWATSVVFSTGGITVYTLTDLMTDISQNRFAHTYLEAKNYISYIEIIVIILVPILSFIMMKIGHKTTFLVAGSVILVGSYTTMMFQPYVGVD